MLTDLSIQNLALIEKLQLNLRSGFTCLTGETGAGKSILLDALGLTLGERADTGLVRHGTPRADVTAEFDLTNLPQVSKWLQEQELDSDEVNCLLRRTVNAKGGSKAYINGIPVPATLLKEIGNQLIDIHGQHEHQTLLHSNKQIGLLDAYAAHSKLLKTTQNEYRHWQDLQQLYQQRQTEQADRQSRIELLSFQLKEFNQVAPQADEFITLSEQQHTLSHASEIQQACFLASQHLDDEGGASDRLQSAIHALEQISSVMPKAEPTLQQLNSLLIDTQEMASELQNQANHIELDPQELQTTEERLSQLFSLAKKYQLEPEQLVAKHQEIQQQLEQLNNPEQSLDALKEEMEAAYGAYRQTAEKLSNSRQKAAKKLAKTITTGMQTLGMPNGQFAIQMSNKNTPAMDGIDQVEFLVSANKGLPQQALAKVASGGELSRISLAIQVATAEVAQLPTLIFDEVDVGIGGAVAEMVGEKLQALGNYKQILSITHLAQVASHGHQHLQIKKSTKKGLTFTEVSPLQETQRIEEIARMIGGMKLSENTLLHATEMLQTAQQK